MSRLVSPTLQQFLDGWGPETVASIADLYTFTLQGGEVLQYSAFQSALAAPAPGTDAPLFLFQSGPRLNRTKAKFVIGTEVSELVLDLYVGANDDVALNNMSSITWQKAAWAGLFDGALCDLWRAYVNNGSVVGTINWFQGRIGEIDFGRTKMTMHVKSLLDLLTVQMPKHLYQAACAFVFGDAMCLFDRTSMQATVAALDNNQNQIDTTFTPSPSTLYDNGTVTGITGFNAGYSRTIGRMDSGTIFFLKPWIFPIFPGDQFTILPGCDHTVDTCQNTFNNLIHYGGFPYIPPPESAV